MCTEHVIWPVFNLFMYISIINFKNEPVWLELRHHDRWILHIKKFCSKGRSMT
ncbi:hypothetical protein RhiirA4_83666 [Rhizophagus irregularis]|uniref:Uncharacterized protein n=1 Tax=Rhizophagus irregularis TaxID=588596 RepID=A0A2I1HA08_9GLOM|nr:hypothetical protein RhiirA4_83666 [Rhizophagus irregularis]